jgi:hypothetical protein
LQDELLAKERNNEKDEQKLTWMNGYNTNTSGAWDAAKGGGMQGSQRSFEGSGDKKAG